MDINKTIYSLIPTIGGNTEINYLEFIELFKPEIKEQITECTTNTLKYCKKYEIKEIELEFLVNKKMNTIITLFYKTGLQETYSRSVNLFYLYDLFNDEGKKFCKEYHKRDVQKIIDLNKESISNYLKEINRLENFIEEIYSEKIL